MLAYVCNTHINEYDWFVRAVDDCYIRPDRLINILSFIDKRKKVQINNSCEQVHKITFDLYMKYVQSISLSISMWLHLNVKQKYM